MEHRNFSMPSNGSAIPDLERVAEALRTLDRFDRAQVAWLMQAWYQLGYEQRDAEDRGYWAGYWARVAEENAASNGPVFSAANTVRGVNQRAYRSECDRRARIPWIGDYHGCPVAWPEDDDQWAAA